MRYGSKTLGSPSLFLLNSFTVLGLRWQPGKTGNRDDNRERAVAGRRDGLFKKAIPEAVRGEKNKSYYVIN